MPSSLFDPFVVQSSPLLWLAVTLAVYRCVHAVNVRACRHPLTTPVALGAAIMMLVLLLSGTPYETYFDRVRLIHFFLGPATVAMAIPLYTHTRRLRDDALPLLVTLVAGSAAAIASSLFLGRWTGASSDLLLSLAPKSTTMPVAMGLTETMGGSASLTSLTVTMTGISGAVIAPIVWRALHVDDLAQRGFMLGLSSHAIGTAYAFQLGEVAGASSALAMGLNSIATAAVLPALLHVFSLR